MGPSARPLDEERKLPAHLAVHDIGEPETDTVTARTVR